MKKILSIVLSMVLVLALSMTAFATTNSDGFSIALNQIGDNSDTIYTTSFPITVPVGGTLHYPTLDTNSGTVIDNQSIQVKFYVSDFSPLFNENGKVTNLDESNLIAQQSFTRNSINESFAAFNFDWIINAQNNYYITVVAKKANDYTNDWQLVNVKLVTATEPAAPAVAADLLKQAGISHKYGKTGNYISDVAKFMGPNTSFADVANNILVLKSDVNNYRIAVKNFLIKKGLTQLK